MTRVARNKGSYTQRKSGGFQVKFPLGWSEEKKKYDEYREDVPTEAEAISLIKSINDFVYHGGRPDEVPAWRRGGSERAEPDERTVSQFFEEFTTIREKQRRVESRTIQSDRECFMRIEPYIGAMPLSSITPHDLDIAFACMRSEGPDNLGGRAYSGTTLQKTYAYLSMLFSKAVDYDYIPKNPMDKVGRPKRDTAEKKALTPEESRCLFGTIASEPLEPRPIGVLICLSCGLRLSEMLALEWADYSDGALRVTKSLVRERQAFKSTKNGDSRTVPCPPPLTVVLDKWKIQQQEWYEEKGLEWGSDTPIVQSRVGNHVLQRSFTKWFAHARLSYPIPDDFTVHGLRHTYVTLLSRDCGIDPRTTRSLSGHKSEQAFATYTHTNEDWQRKAAAQLGNIIAPEAEHAICLNCRHWTASPDDSTKGACWAYKREGVQLTVASCYCNTGEFEAIAKMG